jgi:hypothetical protein
VGNELATPVVTAGKEVMAARSTLGKTSPFPILTEEFTVVLEDASKNAGLFPTAALLPEFTILTCAEAAREQSVMKHRSIFFMKINFREIETVKF